MLVQERRHLKIPYHVLLCNVECGREEQWSLPAIPQDCVVMGAKDEFHCK